jgi:adenylate cyclase
VRAWLLAGRPADSQERAVALRQPFLQLQGPVLIWTGGAVVFTTLNAFESWRLAGLVALTIALGGLSTCALTYLIAERVGRDVTAAALASGVPEEPAGPGVATRVTLAWALATGIPLIGVVLLSLALLIGADVSTRRVAITVMFLGVVGIGFGFIVTRIAARSVADPVESVRRALREVQAGNFETQVFIYDSSETGLLQAGFNHMAAGLRERERLRDLFGRHVGTEVVRQALAREIELGGEVRDCAALFVDVVGSTSLAATRPAPEVVAVLNRFFAVVVKIVHAHEGWVNKFEGDAALCVFGAPLDLDGAATHALAAARELAVRLGEEVTEVRAAIGVSSGPVVAGNVGAEERYEYTVIGDPVNEAARLSELAKHRDPRVLASGATVAAADAREASWWHFDDPVILRGRMTPTPIATPGR